MPSVPRLVPERVRALVFDLDGTLVDSYPAIARSLNHARAAFGLETIAEEEVRRMVGHGLESLVEQSVGSERVAEASRLFREEYRRAWGLGTRALPGALETLQTLDERGYRIAVASNKPSEFSIQILDALAMLALVRVVHGPETVGAAKPDPAMLRACLVSLAASREEAAYVGDMVLDVETASRAGVPVILVAGGSSTEDELRATGERVLRTIGELPDLLAAR